MGGFGGRGLGRGVGRDDKLMSQTQRVTAVPSSLRQCEVGRGQLSKMRSERDIFHSKSGRALFPHTIFLPDRRKFPLSTPHSGSTLQRIEVHTPHLTQRPRIGGVIVGLGGAGSHTRLPQGSVHGRPKSPPHHHS